MKCPYKDECGHYQKHGIVYDKTTGRNIKTSVCCNDSIECEFCGIYKELKRGINNEHKKV